VTVVPTGTVSVAGSNLKLVMLTALGPCGAAVASVVEPVTWEVVGGELALPWPAMPGVVLACDPKSIDGWAFGDVLDPEQLETSSAVAATADSAAAVR
jgi:hypothetical protein